MGTRVPAKQGAPLIISGSILTTDWLTPSNVGQGENYCKKFDDYRLLLQLLAADTAAATGMTDKEDATEQSSSRRDTETRSPRRPLPKQKRFGWQPNWTRLQRVLPDHFIRSNVFCPPSPRLRRGT